MKVFPDANFLVAAGFRPSGDYRRALIVSQDSFLTSEHVLAEVHRNLERLGLDSVSFIEELRERMEGTDKFDLLPVGLPLSDWGDRQALAEAIGAACDLFITSDTDFNQLFGKRVKGVLIQTSARYVRDVLFLA